MNIFFTIEGIVFVGEMDEYFFFEPGFTYSHVVML